MRFIAFDLETGGLTVDKSPLTAYFIVFDENFRIYGELDLKIKPNGDDPYIVTAEALDVNGIDLVEHNKVAVPLDVAKKQLYDFLNNMSEEGYHKLIPTGQNITFDRDFVTAHFISVNNWKRFCSYHHLDTGTLAIFFKLIGIMPVNHKTRVSELVNFFNVNTGKLHTAKEDTLACVKILKKMIKAVKEQNED